MGRVAVAGVATLLAAAGAAMAGPATVTTPAERERPAVRGFTLVAGGDVLTENRVLAHGATSATAAGDGARYDFVPLFAGISPIVAGADLAICHLEVPLGWPGEGVGAFGRSLVANRLRGPAEMADGLRATGFDRCSTASNHSHDMGDAGVDSTLGVLDAAGITHVGTARTADEAAAGPMPFTVNGVRVAHLSWSTSSNTVLPARWRFNYTTRSNPQPVVDEIAAARAAGAEVVIVSVHIGREREHVPFPDDRAFMAAVVGAGADLVIEHGPHVVQPVEQIDGAWVFWSVGNLVSGMGEPGDQRYDASARDGLLAWATVTVTDEGVVTVEPTAVGVCNERWTRTVWQASAPGAPPDCLPRILQYVPTAV